jgi:hypothetical protein
MNNNFVIIQESMVRSVQLPCQIENVLDKDFKFDIFSLGNKFEFPASSADYVSAGKDCKLQFRWEMADGSEKPSDVLRFSPRNGQFRLQADLVEEIRYEIIVTVTNGGNFKILNQIGADVSDEYLTELKIPVNIHFCFKALTGDECVPRAEAIRERFNAILAEPPENTPTQNQKDVYRTLNLNTDLFDLVWQSPPLNGDAFDLSDANIIVSRGSERAAGQVKQVQSDTMEIEHYATTDDHANA